MANNLGTLFSNIANAIRSKNGLSTTYYPNQMADAILAIPTGGIPTLQNKTKSYTPTETQQTESVVADSGYDGLDKVNVTVSAIPSDYVGSEILRRDEDDVYVDLWSAEVVVLNGYYESEASKVIPTNSSSDITVSGDTVSIARGLYPFNETKSVASGSVTAPNSISGTSATVSAGTNTLTFTKTVSVTPNVTSAGYISSGTAGNSSVSLTANVNTRSSSDLTVSGATVTTPAGYYASSASKSVANGTAGTPTATKGTVSNHSISVTPSVTNTTGYITGGTKNGTSVTVSASELVSGSQNITENGTVDVTNLAEVIVNVEGGSSGLKVESIAKTVTSASSSIQFTNLKGNPTSFVVTSSADFSTGGAPYKTAAVVFDGTNVIGQYITNTSNAQMSYDDESFSKSYSNGTLTITGTNSNFQANEYVLVYTYGGTSANIGTEQVQVGSGVTSITFTGLSDEPTYFSCLFTSDIGTSSGYTRAHVVVFDGSGVYGMEMGSGSSATEHWSYTYNNGSLTISSQSTSSGGYFHQPGYYQLTYAVGGEIELTTEPLNVTENGIYTAPKGKAYTPVTVNVSGGGGDVNVETKTVTASNYPVSIQFTSMKGQPKWFALRSTSQISSSGSTSYYYIIDMIYDGNSSKTCQGNCFRIGSTRRVNNITSGYSWSYSGTTLTITSSASSRSSSPGAFNNNYQLVYIY